jgi:cation transport ATPase
MTVRRSDPHDPADDALASPDRWVTVRNGMVAAPALALLAGGALYASNQTDAARWVWIAGIAPVLAVLLVTIVGSLRRGDFGLDVIAALAMSGAVAAGEPLAGAVVALMFAGG